MNEQPPVTRPEVRPEAREFLLAEYNQLWLDSRNTDEHKSRMMRFYVLLVGGAISVGALLLREAKDPDTVKPMITLLFLVGGLAGMGILFNFTTQRTVKVGYFHNLNCLRRWIADNWGLPHDGEILECSGLSVRGDHPPSLRGWTSADFWTALLMMFLNSFLLAFVAAFLLGWNVFNDLAVFVRPAFYAPLLVILLVQCGIWFFLLWRNDRQVRNRR